MNLYELSKNEWPLRDHSVLTEATSLQLNDDHIKAANPDIKFSEYYIKRNKKNLFINIGESWTYGETLPMLNGQSMIGTGVNRFDFGSQIKYSFGPKLACILDADLYQYAVPGNSNVNMLTECDRILNYFSQNNQYDKIYLSLQLTESNRDKVYNYLDYFLASPMKNLYDKESYPNKLTIQEWLKHYHDIVSNWYESIIQKYSALNINAIQWANFCDFETTRTDYTFKRIKPTWIKYSAMLESVEYTQPLVFNSGAFIQFENTFKDVVTFDLDWANEQLDLINNSLDLIQGNNMYHNNHPNPFGHAVWATYLARQAGWKDV